MQGQSHGHYSIFKRKTSPYYYVQFWNSDLERYSSAKSTGKISKREAEHLCIEWLQEYGGFPELQQTVKCNDLINLMYQYLVQNQVIDTNVTLKIEDLFEKVLNLILGSENKSTNPVFIDYLLNFWSWETSPYILDKVESGQSIGKVYCKTNRRFIEVYALPFFKDCKIKSVTTLKLEEFKNSLPRKSVTKKGLTNRSINAVLGCIKTPLNEAKRLGYILSDHSEGMRTLSNNKKSRGILTVDEVAKVFSINWKDERSKIASQIAACYGLREGEIGALKIDDLDFKNLIINVRHSWDRYERKLKKPKNGNCRIIYSCIEILELLKNLYARNPHENSFIFWNTDKCDTPINLDNFRDHLAIALENIGISLEMQRERNINFHSWRHFSNSVLRGNIDDSILRKSMGHLTESMTDNYHHLTEDQGSKYRNTVLDKILPYVL